jgi:hypothetical protein
MEPEVYVIVKNKYASLVDLDRDYSVEDAYDLLEIIDIENSLEVASNRDAEANK